MLISFRFFVLNKIIELMKKRISVLFVLLILLCVNQEIFAQINFKTKGINSFFKKDFNGCIKFMDQAIANGDTSYEVFYYRGLSKIYLNNFEEAVEDITVAINKGVNTPDIYNNRGLAYLFLGDFKLALDDFNKSLEIDSSFSEAYTNRATVYIEIGELEEALNDLNNAIKYNPNNVSSYYERGRVFYKLKSFEEAIENFDKCIKLNLKNSKVYYNRGNSYFKLGNYKKAIEDYTKCLSLDSTDTEALNNRAVAYEKLGMNQQATNDRKKIARLLGNENLFKPIEEITYSEVIDSFNTFKLTYPSHWKVFHKINQDYDEIIITPENIKTDTDFYSVGMRFSFNKNMFSNYSVKSSGEILEFWRGSIEKNSQEYHYYRYLQQKLFSRGEYTGNLYETLVQYWQDSPTFQCYEIALAKEDTLFFGFLQAPSNQFSYFRIIFDKVLNSLNFIK